MPAQSEFGDATTVIDGPSGSFMPSAAYIHMQSLRGKGVESPSHVTKPSTSTFARTANYFSEERPFLVLIDKRGIVAALQELDAQLHAVRAVDQTRVFYKKLTSGIAGGIQSYSFEQGMSRLRLGCSAGRLTESASDTRAPRTGLAGKLRQARLG